MKKEISSDELSKMFDLGQKTCREFKLKVRQAMRSSRRYPLEGEVFVKDFCIENEEINRKTNRGKDGKRRIIVAVETGKRNYGRAYATVVKDATCYTYGSFLKKHVKADADIVMDNWNGYKPLLSKYKNMRQVPSNDGENFPELYHHFLNIKSWLQGKDRHCSENQLQEYLDEYHFKFNRRKRTGVIFDTLIRRMVQNKPKRLSD